MNRTRRLLPRLAALAVLGAALAGCQSQGTIRDVPRPDLPPNTPALVAIAPQGTAGLIRLTWAVEPDPAHAAVTGYTLRASPDGASWRILDLDLGTATAYDDTGLPGGTRRHYQVRAHSRAGASAWSRSASATAGSYRLPGPPRLRVTAEGPTSLALAWELPDNQTTTHTEGPVAPITAFEIEVSATGTTRWQQLATRGPAASRHVHQGLEPRTTRFYRIRAVTGVGASDWSATESATTDHDGTVTPHTHRPPPPPALTATPEGTFSIALEWEIPADTSDDERPIAPATGYEIEVSTTGTGGWTQLARAAAGATRYVHHGLDAGTTRFYRVRAASDAGASGWSAAERATTPPRPVLSVTGETIAEPANAAQSATLTFTLELDRNADTTVSVNWRLEDESATAGSDYTDGAGTAVIPAGERETAVEVTILHDSIDEETETFFIVLSGLTGATFAGGATALRVRGAITNEGALPRAWLAAAARLLGDEATRAIAARAGERRAWRERASAADPSFRPTPGASAGAWTGAVHARHRHREDNTRTSGDLSGGWLGLEAGHGDWSAGLAFQHASLKGDYQAADARTGPGWNADHTLSGVYPYVIFAPHRDLAAWIAGGYALGELRLSQSAEHQQIATDTTLRYIGAGATRRLARSAHRQGAELALHSDLHAAWLRSDPTEGMAGASARTERARVALEGAIPVTLHSGLHLRPSATLGVRADGGEAGRGFGIDASAAFSLASAGGRVRAGTEAHAVLVHQGEDLEHWRVSAHAELAPRTGGRGWSAALGPTLGASADGRHASSAWRIEGRVGYGLPTGRSNTLLTPYGETTWSAGAQRLWRTGARWHFDTHRALDLSWGASGALALEGHWRF